MGIKEKIMELRFVRDYILVSKFGNNIHDVDLLESIQTGVVNRLLIARELGIDYAVVVEGIVPMSKYGINMEMVHGIQIDHIFQQKI